MIKFSKYQPDRPAASKSIDEWQVEPAQPGDMRAIAELTAERDGGDPVLYERLIVEKQNASPDPTHLFVARQHEGVVGYGRVSFNRYESIPTGWYLAGLSVATDKRRFGIGRSLTEHRIEWVSRKADELFYFANSRNLASIDLHLSLGFREIVRGISVPGITFRDGVGILYRLDLGTKSK
ncbi:MAG: GNAT family N-acetyltransferase [Candidatus Eisenbacteria bacterium]|uniref:GNAT family N-acetyltransferase n=1 Tax=Eiseniibacteriota bacterium TaxID=2212470 RepID=A0A7Y2H100_UNCEI|nr:GNAT family N-acetyltransferase [Candidatus Eisenbacteria bacterium]